MSDYMSEGDSIGDFVLEIVLEIHVNTVAGDL
jgi:hypothetical protein